MLLPMRRPLALALSLALAGACSPNAPTPASDSPAGSTGAVEVDPAALLRLEERSFPLLLWAAWTVEHEYFDPRRLDPPGQLASALHDLALHQPEFFAEVQGGQVSVTVGAFAEKFEVGSPTSLVAAAEALEKILEFARPHLDLEDEEAVHKLEYAALNGLLAPLDPHTILLTPEERSDLGVKTKGEFGGIGAEITAEERRIKVVRVLEGSPAAVAGLRAGDLILQIDKQATVNLPAADAQTLLRGPVGSPVSLKIRRGAETLTVTVIRQMIRVESVIGSLLPERVGLLRITTFQENTADQASAAIARLTADGPLRGLVLDLRDNSGGLLTQAMALVDLLVERGDLVIVKSALGRESDPAKPEVAVGPEVGVVALIDENSASASEIVAGGVKALGRGVVIGRTSFGKGTVQMLKPWAPYGRELALKLTVAEYQVAGDTKIQSLGVVPDVTLSPVELTEIPAVARYYDRERFERRRERSQTAHLPSARHEPAPPSGPETGPLLRYLGGPRELAEGEPDALRDPEVRIAQAVAAAIAGVDAGGRAAATQKVIDGLAVSEDQAIVGALAATTIPWDGPAGGSDPEIAVRASVDRPIRAGEPFVLRVEAENRGAAPAQRVHLITECVHDELDGIEVMIGTVAPGKTAVRELRLQVMSWQPDFADALKIAVHGGEPGAAPDATTEVRLEVKGLPRSHLAYDYWIVDDPALVAKAPARPPEEPGGEPFAVKGNGDGVLQAGERVLLAVRARNEGEAGAADVRALLRNHAGAQALLEEGFLALGPVAPGKEVRGSFGITVADAPDLALPVELDLMVADVQLRESARHRLRPRIAEGRPGFVAGAQRVEVKGEGTRLYNGADGKSAVLAEVAAGQVVDVVGRAGGWLAVDLEPGRRGWLPADAVSPVEGPAKGRAALPARTALLVTPPVIAVEAAPLVTKADRVTLDALATHPGRVRDLVVGVRPVGPAQVEDKVFFQANPAREGEAARSMRAQAAVPLASGGNLITITARDGESVEASREVVVFRE